MRFATSPMPPPMTVEDRARDAARASGVVRWSLDAGVLTLFVADASDAERVGRAALSRLAASHDGMSTAPRVLVRLA